MDCLDQRIGKIFNGPFLSRECIRRAVLIGAGLLASTGLAHSGPCTAQIAQFEQQISALPPGPKTGPTAPQTLGAQLHYQPTPGDVTHAEHVANKEGEAAIARAKAADAAGDAAGCNAALARAKDLYAISQ
jgi:uncharacterized iron-regulated membrane protein